MTESRFHTLLLLIVLFSVVTRLLILDYNLPPHIVEDEGSDLSVAAQLLNGELPERHVRYHRSLIAYNNLIPMIGVFAANFVTGQIDGVAAFRDLYFTDRAQFTWATRLWMSLLTSAAIGMVGLATAYYRREVGLLAALILALNGFVLHTTIFAMPDSLVFFAAALALWLIVRLWHFRRSRDYVFASMALAMVMLSKLQAAPMGLALLVAHGFIVFEHVEGNWRRFPAAYFLDKNLWLAAVTGLFANIILNPLAYLRPDDFIYEISRLGSMMNDKSGQTPDITLQLALEELEKLIRVGWRFSLPLVVAGIVAAWHSRRKQVYWLLLAACLPVFFTIWNTLLSPITHFYYWMPFLALMSPLAAIGLWELVHFLYKRRGIFVCIAWLPLLVWILLEGQFFLHIIHIMKQPLTLEQARDYVEETISPDAALISGDPIVYSIALKRNETSIHRAADLTGTMLSSWQYQLNHPDDPIFSPQYNLYGPEMFFAFDSFEELTQIIADEAIEYFIVADYCNPDLPMIDPTLTASIMYPPVNPDMMENWELIQVFSPYEGTACGDYIKTRTKISFYDDLYRQQRGGPIVKIYKIPQD